MKSIKKLIKTALVLVAVFSMIWVYPGAVKADTNDQTLRFHLRNNRLQVSGSKGIYEPIGDLVIPEKVDGIPVQVVGGMGFYQCKKLETVKLPKTIEEIEDLAFSNCSNLKSINLPQGLKHIGERAFEFSGLSVVNIPESVETIGYGAFSCCDKLTVVQLPSNLKEIEEFTFYDCFSLQTVTIPKRVKRIGQYAFSDSVFLSSVYIPASVTDIEYGVFQNCESLKDVWYAGTQEQWDAINIASGNQELKKAKLHLNSPSFFFAEQPQTVSKLKGDTAQFHVVAHGPRVTYQWQYRTGSEDTWKKATATGNNTETLQIPVTLSKNGFQYRCMIKNGNGKTLYSKTVGLYVLNVHTHPVMVRAAAGSTAVFKIAATGHGKTYQWQYQTNTGSWVNATAPGSKTATLQVKATTTKNGFRYRCLVRDSAGNEVYSQAARLYVLGITKQPATVRLPAGQTATFTVEATSSGNHYQWQYRTSTKDSWKNVDIKDFYTNTLKVYADVDKAGYQYRCMISDDARNTVYSKTVALYVLGFKSQPETAKVVAGNTAVFKVKATGYDKTYQWQYRASADSPWRNASATGNKTATLKVPATVSRSAYQYRCVVKDSAGNTVNSKAVSLYVLGIKTQPAAAQAVAGTNAAFKVEATGHGKTYQWQYRTSPEGAWKNAAATGNKTANLKVPATVSRSGYQYRCVVKDSAGNTVYSDAATLYVLGIAAQPQTTSVAAGETAVFTVSATGYGPTYQWQYRASPEAQWQNVTEATAAQLQFTAEIGMNGYEYRCVVTDFLENTVYSDAVTLTVTEPPVEEEPPATEEPPIVEEPPTEEVPPLGEF